MKNTGEAQPISMSWRQQDGSLEKSIWLRFRVKNTEESCTEKEDLRKPSGITFEFS